MASNTTWYIRSGAAAAIFADSAAVIAERLRAAVDALKLPHQASAAGEHVTVSLGVATMAPSDASSHADLLAAADEALYQAKREGRNRCVSASALGAG